MTSVLAKLYEIDQTFDATIVKQKVASMIAGFIKQASPDNPIFPPDPNSNNPTQADPGAQVSKLEPGTFPVLNYGEEVQFAEMKDSGDFNGFIRTCLQAFAIGAGMAEYQITGDLSKINFSSIRAGLLEFRRKCEQFQHSVFIFQVCHPVYRRWLQDAMLSQVFDTDMLIAYDQDPEPFEACQWVTPGWPWVDPLKDIQAASAAIRNGLSTRSIEAAAQGRDSITMDNEQESDNQRADQKNLSYDSDGRKVLTGRNAGLTEGEIEEDTEGDDEGKVQIQ